MPMYRNVFTHKGSSLALTGRAVLKSFPGVYNVVVFCSDPAYELVWSVQFINEKIKKDLVATY